MPSNDWANNRVLTDGDVPPKGYLLSEARKACFLTQAKLAEIMGRCRTLVGDAEINRRILSEEDKKDIIKSLTPHARTSKAKQSIDALSNQYMCRSNSPFSSKVNRWSFHLIKIRTILNVPQIEMAEYFGISARSLRYWEYNEHIPTHRVLDVCDKLALMARGNTLVLSLVGQLRSDLPKIVKKGRPFRKKYAKKKKLKVEQVDDSIDS